MGTTRRARRYRQHSAAEQVAILRQVLLEGQAVSKVCEEHDVSPTLFYAWQKQFFENGAAAFDNAGKHRKSQQDGKDKKIAALEDKLQRKNEVLSELMEEHVQLKKELGEP